MERVHACARLCAVFILAAGTAGVCAAGERVLQVPYGSGELVLVPGAAGARLDFPGGRRLALALPAGGELTSVAAAGDGWVAAGSFTAEDGRQRLLLLAGDERSVRRLPAPAGQSGRLRRTPVVLTDGDRLAGLAWLEGDGLRSLAVAVAEARDDGSWRRPVRVSAPGSGSQLGLTGAVLADGSWLLAWSAFDGGDDEIVWSRRLGGSWLPAARVSADNAVPDITPALTAAGSGALLAWSRYDGNDYRLMLARFAGGEWRDERVAGGAGTLFPTFSGDRERPCLVYQAAAAGGWAAAELDAGGRVVRHVDLPSTRTDRPVVGVEGSELRLAWPAADASPAEER